MQTDPIEILTSELKNLTKEWYQAPIKWSDKEWTTQIKKTIADACTSYSAKCHPMCNGLGDDYQGEWLFDVIWYEVDEENRMTRLPLVCESEWKTEEWQINIDFDKLLIAHSDYKVFVFQKRNGEMVLNEFKRLRSRIEAFQSSPTSPEKYLLAGFDSNDQGIFHFQEYEKLGSEITTLITDSACEGNG